MPNFGSWTPWAARFDVKGRECPGVYLMGRFDSTPPSIVEPISARVIYIGETCQQSLTKRWYQFHRSAFERKGGHSGGLTFCDLHRNAAGGATVPWLYVTALPVKGNEPRRSAYIRFIERWLLLQYVEKFGVLPPCNSK